jgi:hypothetical protein
MYELFCIPNKNILSCRLLIYRVSDCESGSGSMQLVNPGPDPDRPKRNPKVDKKNLILKGCRLLRDFRCPSWRSS